MNKLNKLSTKTKLRFGFGIIISSILILLIISFFSINRIENLHEEIIGLNKITRNLTQLRSDENRLRGLTLEYLLNNDKKTRDTILYKLGERTTKIENLIITLDSLLIDLPEQKLFFKKIETDLLQYNVNRTNTLSFADQGKMDEALNYIKSVQNNLYEEVRLNVLILEKQLDNITSEHIEQNKSLSKLVNYTLFILGIGIIIISLLLAISMLKMLKKIADEIRNGVNILGTSAAEILSTVTEISTAAAETATAVSETTTTVEEVRQTAMVSNQKAQLLMEFSQNAADSVEKGRESINEVIASMKRIDNQMNIISDTVMKLSDQNRTISEITSSVADIADQSNLLAVNAAIEAAKAGEHGRGFTVVAQEIRSLADQSKKATAQIKEILNEINKSVNQAVAVTELGTKTVEEGINLVALSGEVIEILSENVEETAESSIQISSSNQQQMAGMEQIVPAMENIKQASEQNVTGIKQTQAAAHDLNNLGQNLKEVIEKFNL
jgi:methyl-accepting chemotaxis protein